MRKLSLIYALSGFIFCMACGEIQKKEEKDPSEAQVEKKEEKQNDSKIILFFGNSLTAGMGLDPNEAFPAVIQKKIDSLNLPYEAVNAGVSGETTAGGKNRIGWLLNQQIDIFVLELGANDGLRGIPLEETRKNLQAIIDTVRAKNTNTKILLAGMQIPPNLGPAYTSGFRNIFPELAGKNDIRLIPFLLKDVAGNPGLNQEDGIHPTAEGQKILAENVWAILQPLLEK